MHDFDTESADKHSGERAGVRDRVLSALSRLVKKLILFIAFGPGVLGFLWLIGRIFKR